MFALLLFLLAVCISGLALAWLAEVQDAQFRKLTLCCAFLSAFCVPPSALGEIIPAARRMDWTVAAQGVPGDVDARPIWKSLLEEIDGFYQCWAAVGHDDSIGIDRAMDGVTNGSVIYLGAGTYRLTNAIASDSANDNWTLRGAGRGQTILKFGSTGFITIGALQNPRPSTALAVTAGATKDSTTVTVASATLVNVGAYIRLQPTAMPVYGHNLDDGSGAADTYSTAVSIHLVTAKNATTVTFTPALPIDLSALSPLLVYYAATPAISRGISIEDLTIDLTDSDASTAIAFYGCWGGRLKNVEIKFAKHHNVEAYGFCSGQVIDCVFGDIQGVGPSHIGLDFIQDNCWNRIENSNFQATNAVALMFGDASGGNCGNVVFNNYIIGSSPNWDASNNHGPHTWFNLWEANWFGQVNEDGFSGSASHNTFLRNKITAANSGYCLVIARNHNYYNIVGNIIGRSGWSGVYEITASDDSAAALYRLGYPNLGNATYTGTITATTPPNYSLLSNNRAHADNQKRDLNVANTIIRHGNYDYVNNGQTWEGSIADHDIPTSYAYPAGPPPYIPSGFPWPMIQPDAAAPNTNWAYAVMTGATNGYDSGESGETNITKTVNTIHINVDKVYIIIVP